MVLSTSAGEKIIYPDQKLEPISQSQKMKSTLLTFAKAGGATLLSVFIPVLHFVTVPVGLIVTAFLTYSAYKKKYVLKNFEVHCPNCDKKSTTSVSGSELPLRTFCSHCRHMIYINN